MEICELKQSDEKAWDEYVLKHPDSTFYHQIGWKNVVEKSYGHKPYYLLAKENGEIKGILPIFFTKNMLFGKKMVSIPFAPYGGVCADDIITENALFNEAKKLTELNYAKYLELRTPPFKEKINQSDESIQVTSILYLDSNLDVIWKKIKRDKKRGINLAKTAQIEISRNTEKLDDFYNLYNQTMHNLGSPTHNLEFFKHVLGEFPNTTDIIVAKKSGVIVGCIFLLFFKKNIISGWSASNRKYQKFHPNDLCYWEAIKHGCENKYNVFDFGRSMPNSGVHNFKKSFGAQTKYLHYHYYLNNISIIPNQTTSNVKRQKFAQLWKNMPDILTNKLGPLLRGNFP